MGYDGSLKFDTKIDTGGFNSGINKIGSIAKGGLAVVGSLAVGVTAAFAATTKASLDSVASLEQNIGGVETLFKNSADVVIANAKKAYETAGLSANNYMSTVTSFSASLLQSLAGDTEKAAEYADRAIVDMSDNANKMGTSMELIQNAYQGFAKQNYTMLDNLKLGYGGTKEEMERLISDASKMTDVQKELGVTVDGSSLSFGNIVNAISVMQKSMGIAGTTAKEAATTIEGSMNSAKAAWDNFLNGTISADDFADTISIAVENIAKNLGEIVPRLASTIPEVGKDLYEMIASSFEQNGSEIAQAGMNVLEGFASGIMDAAPKIVNKSAGIVTDFANGICDAAPGMLTAAVVLIEQISSGIVEQIPGLLQAGYGIIDSIVSGIVLAIPTALPKVLDFVQGIGDKLSEAAPNLIQKGFDLLQKLVDGITSAIPILIEKVPQIISTFANIINDNFPTILLKGAQLLGQLALGLIQAIPTLVANIPQIIQAIIDALMAFQWLSLGKSIITGLCNGIKSMAAAAGEAGINILNSIKNAFLNLPSTLANFGKSAIYNLGSTISGLRSYVVSAALRLVSGIESTFLKLPGKLVSIGKNLVKGLWNGISDMTGWILDKIKGFGESVLNGIKSFFGIHSPSTVFRDEIGKYLALGIGVGFKDNIPVNEINDCLENAINNIDVGTMNKRLSSMMKSIQSSAIDGASVSSKSAVEKNVNYKNDKNSEEIDYERLGKEMSKRPINVSTKINGRELIRMSAVPMQEQFKKNEAFKSMLRGEKVQWVY